MPTILKTKNSVTTTVVPTTLQQGELAVNITDKKIWVGNAATTPVQLLGDGGSGSFTSIAFGAGTVSAPSITFTGDTNTGIYSPAADTIAFTEGGVEAMRIDSSANVGIGTSSPTARLGIPIPEFSASSTSGMVRFQNPNVAADSCIQSYYVSSDGSDINIGANSFVNTAGSTVRFSNSYASSAINIRRDGVLAFRTNTSAGDATERMRISSTGNLSLGTTVQAMRQNIYGTDNNTVSGANIWNYKIVGINIRNESTTANTMAGLYFECGAGNSASAVFNIQESASLGALGFATGGSGVSSTVPERMRIDSSGNVGIGTSSPAYQLTVAGYSNANAANKFAIGSIADYQALFYYENGNETFTIENTSDYASSAIIFKTNNAERMRITSGGEVRIGTTDITNGGFSFEAGYNGAGKSAALFGHITGTGSGNQYCIFYYDGTIIGSITQNGTTAVAYNTTSDYRLKENIAPMTNALAKVAQLKPVTYTWKADGSDGQGFIAHELQAVVPDAVTGEKDAVDKNGKPTYQGVDTSYLVATLTAAIQEQQAMIEELKQEVAKLKGN